ncbi:hypothetical protein CT3_18130 [Comamonas terrigena NBRC 13299]|nr:hypothetical protein CT3_18130 [Comamonas terrigena NBRC 13299]
MQRVLTAPYPGPIRLARTGADWWHALDARNCSSCRSDSAALRQDPRCPRSNRCGDFLRRCGALAALAPVAL